MSDIPVDPIGADAPDNKLGRRTVLRGVAIGGVSIATLAACGSGGGDATGSSDPGGASSANGNSGGGSGGGGSAGSTTLGPASQVPVGGGVIYADEQVVVTQPEADKYHGFSAICTHMSCMVSQVADGTIDCPCHGSRYSIEDGSVVNGPATQPLPPRNVTIKGKEIMLA